jgi:tetratricopeptide (TPR) repeat protein
VLLQIAETEINNPRIFLKTGDIYQRSGEKAEAIVAHAHASQILRMQGFLRKALAAYKIALCLDPDNQDLISCAEILMDEREKAKNSICYC